MVALLFDELSTVNNALKTNGSLYGLLAGETSPETGSVPFANALTTSFASLKSIFFPQLVVSDSPWIVPAMGVPASVHLMSERVSYTKYG